MQRNQSAVSLKKFCGRGRWLVLGAAVVFSCATVTVRAQDGAAQAGKTAASQSGTVKSTGNGSLVITTAAGQDVTINVGDSTKILIVPPGSKTLSAATPGSLSDAAAGDKALVTGSADGPAARVVLMKSGAIAQAHAADNAAWAQGVGGIVKSANGLSVVISSGMKTITVQTAPNTIYRRYSGASVKFDDAVASTLAAIQPGDQLRVRGTKSPDGSSITADEIVSGAFRNFSGTIASIDAAGGTISLKDLTTKKNVTVAVTSGSDVRRLPAQMANMVAGRMRGGNGAAGGGNAGGGRPEGAPAGGEGEGGEGAGRRQGRAGSDLSSMLSRLPTETLGGLKSGEAVMIVASAPSGDSAKDTAITLLVGVEAILAAPAGEGTTLSPWSMGGGEGGGGGGMGGGGMGGGGGGMN